MLGGADHCGVEGREARDPELVPEQRTPVVLRDDRLHAPLEIPDVSSCTRQAVTRASF